MARVLVTDGDERTALATVRSLGCAGHHVFVCSDLDRSLAGASRYCQAEQRVPDPLASPDGFFEALLDLVDRWKIQILLPISEAALLSVLPNRAALDGVVVPFPNDEQFRRITDKPLLMERAKQLGVGVPAQVRLDEPTDWERRLTADLRFPLVVKPARSVVETGRKRTKSAVLHVADPPSLESALQGLSSEAYPVLVQERIVGPGIGVFLLIWEGELLASFFHRRIREKPPSGGVSVYRESIPPNAELLARSLELLEEFAWQGVAMVEYKVEARTGIPYLMEVNGRFWGSLQLAIDAGVNFPLLLLSAATGQRPVPIHQYKVGLRSRWWWGDLDYLLIRLRRSAHELSLPRGTSGRFRALMDFLVAHGPQSRNEIFRLSDPRPALTEARDWFRPTR